MKIHDEANPAHSCSPLDSPNFQNLFHARHDQNHNSSVVAIKTLEKHIKSHLPKSSFCLCSALRLRSTKAIYNAFMFRAIFSSERLRRVGGIKNI